MTDSSDEYRVGYGHPPRETRWKKGQSGDPRRRKTKSAGSLVNVIDRMLLAPVRVTHDGEPREIATLEAIVLQVLQKALSGNARARRVFLRYLEFASQGSRKEVKLRFVDTTYTDALGRSGKAGADG